MANICYQFSGSNFFNIALTYLTYYLKMKLLAADRGVSAITDGLTRRLKKTPPGGGELT